MEPGSDDFVRTRLTHSLEVAQIGRQLGASLGADPDLVEGACLAHDLGHPPFGHNGETVLEEACTAIGGFEGNAQTFRLLTRLEAKRFHPHGRSAGLNLTRATLDAATKYPWRRSDAPIGSRKYGVYEDDADVFAWMREGTPEVRVCLEAQVMDWSDDVGYSVHDVEDAVAAGRLDLRVLSSGTDLEPVLRLAGRLYAPTASHDELMQAAARLRGLMVGPGDGGRAWLAALKDMTSTLIGRFVLAAEEATRARHGTGPLARYAADLVVPAATRAECAVLKGLAAHFVMFSSERVPILAEERGVIEGLLTAYTERPGERLDPVHRADLDAATDDAARRRVVVDQIASLSDVRARVLFALWCG